MKYLGTLLAMLATAGMLSASPCGVVHYPAQNYGFVQHHVQQNVHHDYDVKKRVVVLEYQLIPSYPIGLVSPYTAPVAAPLVQSPCDVKTAQLEAKIQALEARLNGGTGTPPGTLPLTSPERKTPTLSQKCSGCHGKAVAASKGKNLVLFGEDGKLVNLDDSTYGSVLRVLSDGSMPKGNKLTQDEFTGCLQELVNVHSK